MIDDETAYMPRWFTMSPLPGPNDAPPPSDHVLPVFGARSRRGAQDPINGDHYLIQRLARQQETLLTSLPDGEIPRTFYEYGYAMVIADGLGTAGELASRLAISSLVHLAIYYGKGHVRTDEPIAEEIIDRVERFYRSVDSTLRQASQQGPRALKTTLTAVFTIGTELFFSHVGHSRAYVFRDDQLMQLTHDHTETGQPGQSGIVGMPHPERLVTQRLGGRAVVGAQRIDLERCGLIDGDLILLCTNGLTDVADDEHIAAVLRSHRTPDEQCCALLNLAEDSGTEDDVTALVAQYRIRPRSDFVSPISIRP